MNGAPPERPDQPPERPDQRRRGSATGKVGPVVTTGRDTGHPMWAAEDRPWSAATTHLRTGPRGWSQTIFFGARCPIRVPSAIRDGPAAQSARVAKTPSESGELLRLREALRGARPGQPLQPIPRLERDRSRLSRRVPKDPQDSGPFESKLTFGGVVPSVQPQPSGEAGGTNFPGGKPTEDALRLHRDRCCLTQQLRSFHAFSPLRSRRARLFR